MCHSRCICGMQSTSNPDRSFTMCLLVLLLLCPQKAKGGPWVSITSSAPGFYQMAAFFFSFFINYRTAVVIGFSDGPSWFLNGQKSEVNFSDT